MLPRPEDITPDMYDALNREIERAFEEGCHGNCASCSSQCGKPIYPRYAKALYAVTGGKGGTGKSTITALLAAALAKRGLRVVILDADIAGATQPRLFGAAGKITGMEKQGKEGIKVLTPLALPCGVELMSFDLFDRGSLAEPVLLPGKDMFDVVSYFYTNGAWEGFDIILVDMPSGAGDIPLNLYSSFPVDGTVIVAEPGELGALQTLRCIALCSMLMSPPVAFVENKALEDRCTADALYPLPPDCVRTFLPLSPDISLAAETGSAAKISPPSLTPVVKRLSELKYSR